MSTESSPPIVLVPAGKIRCYIHDGIFRKDTPEEHVRQRVARSLVEEYGYGRADIEIEFPIKMGSSRKRVDIAIFPQGQSHIQDNISIIVEAKRGDADKKVLPSDRKEGVEQLKSYMAACVRARWGLWIGTEMQAFEKETDPQKAESNPFPETTDVPQKGNAEPKRLEFLDLVPATEGLSKVFSRCHNYLHVNGNMGKEKAFFELLKLIFCKMHDEQNSNSALDFCIAPEERRSVLGQRRLKERIAGLFDTVKTSYPYIFPNNHEEVELDNRSLAYCVGELQKFSFMRTDSDIKGEAYEEIVGVTSRRDHGAFFTPRNVCDMAVQMVLATYPVEQRLRLKILDPACGTGGFLRAALLQIRQLVEQREHHRWGRQLERAEAEIRDSLRRICNTNIFGIDKLAELVRAAQMNLALHGDGSTNVFPANSLSPPGEWADNVRRHIALNSFDVVFATPPFGSHLQVDDPHALELYGLARAEAKNIRTGLPPEQLFVERCLDFLKPGGRMAIVLPDSILSNPGLLWLRRWVLSNAHILASVDLPRETFTRSGVTPMTSVLVLQKLTMQERAIIDSGGKVPEHDIFMAIADAVGWDLRGQPRYLRTPEGEEILRKVTKTGLGRDAFGNLIEVQREEEEAILHDQLPGIAELYEEWLHEHPVREASHA